jgi:hypothetical protein
MRFGLSMMLALLLTAGAATADRAHLSADDFMSWRGDTGQWEIVGDVKLDPENPKKLKGEPGTGVLLNGPEGKTKHLVSQPEFGDVRAHIEFAVPEGSNSGVYFMGRYEIQVLDSWGVEEPEHSDCGGIYQRWDDSRDPKGFEGHPPKVNAARKPGEWQSFDVVFRAPRFDENGKKTENARFVEVRHNGQLVHENIELTGPTRSSFYQDEKAKGPLMLQGDHGPVAYRNIWLEPIGE